MRRATAVLLAVGALIVGRAGEAGAQTAEAIRSYDVVIEIREDGDLLITETIDYDFGANERHGIFRDVPTRLIYDDTYDRVYRLEVESVTATGAPDDVEVTEEGISTHIRVGDPDETVTGRHTYTIVYRVEGALNGFPDRDELYWNAIGTEWSVPIERAHALVRAPAAIPRVACFQGYEGSPEPCVGRAEGSDARFEPSRTLGPSEGLTVVVELPKGAVPDPEPILQERWAFQRAFSLNVGTVAASAGLLAVLGFWLSRLLWRTGRDRRFLGSAIDQIHGSASGGDEAVPIGEGDAEAPVEFAPPEELRPGQIGTLLDERANVVDVTATIVDLATRGYLVIHEIPKEGWFGKADWRLMRQPAPGEELLRYEMSLLDAIFEGAGDDQVLVSELKAKFAERLHTVQDELYQDAVRRGWFAEHPDKVRKQWSARGLMLTVVGGGSIYVLARWTHLGLLGLPVVLAGLGLLFSASRMPARTAAGTALVRRVRGFRVVIDKAETHISRWAEQENVFTRFLPYAIVFGLTEKWARAFEGLATQPDTASWYVGTHPFTYAAFGSSIDGFAVTTGGTLASTPSGSGSSGFGGGGSSGGGGGGGGGGSW
jgi:uncharacterized protein (TIGR04222 family)